MISGRQNCCINPAGCDAALVIGAMSWCWSDRVSRNSTTRDEAEEVLERRGERSGTNNRKGTGVGCRSGDGVGWTEISRTVGPMNRRTLHLDGDESDRCDGCNDADGATHDTCDLQRVGELATIIDLLLRILEISRILGADDIMLKKGNKNSEK